MFSNVFPRGRRKQSSIPNMDIYAKETPCSNAGRTQLYSLRTRKKGCLRAARRSTMGRRTKEILGFEIRAFSFLRLNCQSRVESEKANVGAQKSRKARERVIELSKAMNDSLRVATLEERGRGPSLGSRALNPPLTGLVE